MNLINPSAISNYLNLESIIVSNDNNNYKIIDGILFTQDTSQLIACPANNSPKDYTTPEELKEIFPAAFYCAKNLQSIFISRNVTSIYSATFFNCANLREVTILGEVLNLGANAFSQCNNLETFTINSTVPPQIMLSSNYYFLPFSDLLKIFVPKASLNLYKATPKWRIYANNIFPIK